MIIRKTSETRPLTRSVVNEYSESTENAYSCDFVNKAEEYSTSEVKTNKRWIDGKPVYRKVITGTNPSSQTQLNIDLPTTVDTITNYYYQTSSSANYRIDNNYVENGVVQVSVAVQATTTNQRLYFGTLNSGYYTRPYILIVEYTKTTD